MRKSNEELDELIAQQETLVPEAAGMVDVRRGHVAKASSQLIKNRSEAIKVLESQKELTTVNLKAGI